MPAVRAFAPQDWRNIKHMCTQLPAAVLSALARNRDFTAEQDEDV